MNRYINPLLLILVASVLTRPASGELVRVRYIQGDSHGLLLVRNMQDEVIAWGDDIQTVRGNGVTNEIVLRFRDGSYYDDTTVFSQRGVFRVLSDHVIERGPSFPHDVDTLVNMKTGEVTVKMMDKGKEETSRDHLQIPKDVANGLTSIIPAQIDGAQTAVIVSMVTTSGKPRVVKLNISAQGETTFKLGDSSRKATDYVIKTEIGGVAGVVAPLVGKQPPEMHVWIAKGHVPLFLRFQGILFGDGPVWRIDLVGAQW